VTSLRTVLTIAGSDPSGGAGLQADLKTFSRLRVYGTAVVAALTAQNTLGVLSVADVDPDFVGQQLDAILTDIRLDAAKTGMLLTAGVIEAVARKVKQYGIPNFVVDPVMIASSGAVLMQPDAVMALRNVLIPEAFLLTPNVHEAGTLSGITIREFGHMEEAAVRIHKLGARHVLIKGGHLEADEATDIWFDGNEFVHFRSARIQGAEAHGTGCVLSAAIAAYLALGNSVHEAIMLGKELVTDAIRNALQVGKGTRACDPLELL
jgi:hydroxymethylpyrimidine/phosphomethylpyrimidine kinase